MHNSHSPDAMGFKDTLLGQAKKAFDSLGYIPYLLSCQLSALGISVPKLESSLNAGTWR